MKRCVYLLLGIFLLLSCNDGRSKAIGEYVLGGILKELTSDITDSDAKDATHIERYAPVGYEIPVSDGRSPEQLIYRKSYVCSYNKDTRSANWVGWFLSAEHADGDVKRNGMPYIEDDDSIMGRQLLSDWEYRWL